MDQAGLKLGRYSCLCSGVLGLILYATMPGQVSQFSSSVWGVDKERQEEEEEVELFRKEWEEPGSRVRILRQRKGIFSLPSGETGLGE